MAEYYTLEASTCAEVTAKPFTRIPGKPSWKQKELLIDEANAIAMSMHVEYGWAGNNGLMAVIYGAEKYRAITERDYIQPERPAHQHPDIFITNPRAPTQQQVKNLEAQNDQWKSDFAVYSGFCKGVKENLMQALDARYYKQLRHTRYKYRDVTPRMFIEHLESKWVFLDEMQKQQLKDDYVRGWDTDEHISAFVRRLSEDQRNLGHDGIIISDVDKNQHFVNEIWKSGFFDERTMTEWTNKPEDMKGWDQSVVFFETKTQETERYEASCGGGASKNGFDSANAVVAEKVDLVIDKMNSEQAMAVKTTSDTNNKIATMEAQTAALTAMVEKLTSKLLEKRTPPRKHRSRKRARIIEESSDEESDTEDEPTPVKPARRRRKFQKKKGASSSSFKPGDKYTTKMTFPLEEKYAVKLAFWSARKEFQETGTKEAKADIINMYREKVQYEEEREPRNKKRYDTAKGFLRRAEQKGEESE